MHTRTRKAKQEIISISDSDQESDDDNVVVVDSDQDSESESDSSTDEESGADSDDDDDDESEDSDDPSSEDDDGSVDYDDDDKEEEDEDEDDEDNGEEDGRRTGKPTEKLTEDGRRTGKPTEKLTEDEIYNKIVDMIHRRKSLNTLKLEECKAYLRKHQLRLSGSKETCIERILEHLRVFSHWRSTKLAPGSLKAKLCCMYMLKLILIKDGIPKKLYPWESFSINCTGDVCTGDVIRFKQKVYKKFDKITRGRGGKVIGKRTIAGRVVKESYGAAKQQHTFTVEVFWSQGVKPLAPLFPLLVKGRNLYKMQTFRQPWSDEKERSKVLDEKHKRGAAARQIRAIAKARPSHIGSKRCKSSSTRAPPEKRRKKNPQPATIKKKQKIALGKASSTVQAKVKQPSQLRHLALGKASSTVQAKVKQPSQLRHLESSASHPKATSYPGNLLQSGASLLKTVPHFLRNDTTASSSHPKDNSYHGNVAHMQAPLPRMYPPQNHQYTQMGSQERMLHSYHQNASYASSAAGAYHHNVNPRNYTNHHYENPIPWFEDPRNPRHIRPGHFNSGPYFR